MTKRDIQGLEDIRMFVDRFYDQVRKDELLSPVFFSRIPGSWQAHLERMYLFWNAALFGEKGYVGNPFSKHVNMDIYEAHFNRWLRLFTETIDSQFTGPMAEDAKWRAALMARHFQKRLNETPGSNGKTLV